MKALLKEDEKRKLLQNFKTSGQTQAAFAELNGINPKTLARWIYQARLSEKQNQANVEFVEVKRTLISSGRNITVRKAGMEIEIPFFDAAFLRELLGILNAL